MSEEHGPRRTWRRRYALLGFAVGGSLVWLSTVLNLMHLGKPITIEYMVLSQLGREPLLWIIDLSPFLLSALAYAVGRRQDETVHLNSELGRRVGELLAANEQLADEMVEREHLEEQLRHSQKLEAIGQLAGGIAHDFNNLLTAILGYADLLLAEFGPDDRRSGYAGEIHRAGDRAAALVQQLLGFGRKQMVRPRVVDVNAVLRESRRLLERVIGEHLRLDVIEAEGEVPVFMDPMQIEQILVNLVVNARDAMPGGGIVTVRASTAGLGLDDCDSSEDATPGDYCILEVIDTGVGMDDATIERIFEPFFTTKGRAEGSGLGLATTYGIVRQNHGFINVYSHLGCGSTFRVFLPMQDEAVIADEQADVDDSPRGTECILLVEDEDTVRELASTVLRQWGYHVLEARHADEAVHIWKRERDTIDLLLTDVIMPGSDGRKLCRLLRQERPDIPVLFMSGYDDKMMNRHAELGDMPDFIPKPFTAQKLTVKVREVLDA